MKIVSANITGSLTLNNVDITTTVQSSSIWSGSFSTRVTSLESFSSSLDATYATDAQLTSVSQSFSSSISILSGSLQQRIANTETTSSNLTTASGSFSTRVSNTEATASSLVNASSSFSTRVSTNETNISNLQTASGSFSTRVSSLETASGSFSTRVSTNETNISNLQNASSSFSTRVTSAESSITSIQGVTGSYATTGSNNFVGNQRISSTNNAIGFTSTASLYADGGLRVTKDAYISGTLYLNNLTVYGTQSVQYITASQLNISTNIISVNTDTPSIRYGGLSVYDSGSTGLTGSLLWDSEQNHWIYTNPSGSGYSGGMLISGPRASALGAEQGTTCNALMKGQGGDHITSSGIFDYGTCTSFYGNTNITSTGVGCFAGTICAPNITSTGTVCSTGNTCFGGMSIVNSCLGIGTSTPQSLLHLCSVNNVSVRVESACDQAGLRLIAGVPGTARASRIDFLNGATCVGRSQWTIINDYNQNGTNDLAFVNCDPLTKVLQIFQSGVSCFASTVCTPTLVAGTGGIRSSNNIIFPANLTTFTIWNEGYGGAVQLRRSDATTDRYARIGIVDGSGNWVAGMTINGSNSNAEFGAGICGASYVCATGGAVFASTNIRVSTGTAAGNSSDPAITTGGCTKTGIYFDGSCVALGSGGNSLLLAQNGNVGIGTSTPTCKLEVDGGSSAVALRISTTSPSTGTAALILANSSKSAFNDGMIMTHGGGYTNITGLTGATIMAWDMSNCRVGIGTVSPSHKLDVNGSGRYIGSLTINEDGGGTKVLTVRSDWAGVDPAINVTTNNCLLLMTNNTVRVCLSNTGIATFACQVCAPAGIYVGNTTNNTIFSSSRIHLNTCIQRLYTINHWELANGSANQCIVVDGAATYGCAKVANINATETFFYGPYSYLTPGSYVAKFRMKVDNNSSRANLLYLDTNRGSGSNISANTFCTSGCYQYITLPFTISSPSDVFEARALNYTPGITCTYLDHVLIEAAENPGQYFSKDNFRLYTGHFNCSRLSIDTNGNTIFNCNGTYCSNYAYNFLGSCNGSMLSGTHTMGNVGAGNTCATPYWCLNGGVGGALRLEFNWSTGGYVNFINHNNCTPYLMQWSTDYNTKHCFDYVGNACHCGIVMARGFQGAGFSSLSAGAGTSIASFDTITRSGPALYEVYIIANPNAGGANYNDFYYGTVLIGTGYSGTAVTDYIVWCQTSTQPRSLYGSGGGNLTVSACMYYGGAEYSCVGYAGSYTIRFKISGYNSSYTGAGTTIFMSQVI